MIASKFFSTPIAFWIIAAQALIAWIAPQYLVGKGLLARGSLILTYEFLVVFFMFMASGAMTVVYGDRIDDPIVKLTVDRILPAFMIIFAVGAFASTKEWYLLVSFGYLLFARWSMLHSIENGAEMMNVALKSVTMVGLFLGSVTISFSLANFWPQLGITNEVMNETVTDLTLYKKAPAAGMVFLILYYTSAGFLEMKWPKDPPQFIKSMAGGFEQMTTRTEFMKQKTEGLKKRQSNSKQK